jgi:hypothetical protein
LKKLRGSKNIEFIRNEMAELKTEKDAQKQQILVSYKDLFLKRDLRKPLIAAIVIQISQVYIYSTINHLIQ